jgi:hypothetical protein
MDNKNRFAGTLLLLLLATGCEEPAIRSHWTSQSPIIDGKLDEWDAASSVKVDDDIAVNVRFSGQDRNLAPGNLTIWLDPTAGHNKEWTVYFPAASHADFNERRGGFWQGMTAQQVQQMSDSLNTLRDGVLVVNKNGGFRKLYLPHDKDGFSVAYSREGEFTTVEARIPITFDPSFENLTKLGSDRKLTLGLLPGSRPGFAERPRDPSFEPMRPVRDGLDQPATRQEIPRRREFKKPEELWMEVILAHEE